MARFYSNENFHGRVVACLRSLGHDVRTSFEAGRANRRIPDDEVLRFATSEDRTVLTLNRRDFIELHSANQLHAGIITCTPDANARALAARIDSIVPAEGQTLHGKLLRVVKPNLAPGEALRFPDGIAQGAALLLGSLLWEGEKKSDGEKGERRKAWRDKRLQTEVFDVPGLPMWYGRWSETRDEYTMVLARGKKGGLAKAREFKLAFGIAGGKLANRALLTLKEEVLRLAKAEGIGESHISPKLRHEPCPWGLVALWPNRSSPFVAVLEETWKKHFGLDEFSKTIAKHMGGIPNTDGIITLPWPAAIPSHIDYLLCTPTLPKDPLPTGEEIRTKAGEYYKRTKASGILTELDA
jgi:hypothetical protein